MNSTNSHLCNKQLNLSLGSDHIWCLSALILQWVHKTTDVKLSVVLTKGTSCAGCHGRVVITAESLNVAKGADV